MFSRIVAGGTLANSGGSGASLTPTTGVEFVADNPLEAEAGCPVLSIKLAALLFVVRSEESGPFCGGTAGLFGECVPVGRKKSHAATTATAQKSKRPVRTEPVTAPVYRLLASRKEDKTAPEDWRNPRASR